MIVSYSDKEKRTGKLFPATSQCVPVMLYITLVTFIIAYSDFFVYWQFFQNFSQYMAERIKIRLCVKI